MPSSSYISRLFPEPTASMLPARANSDPTKKRSLPFKAPSRVDKTKTVVKPTPKAAAKKQTAKVTTSKQAKAAYRGNGNFKPTSKTVVLSDDDEVEEDEELADEASGQEMDATDEEEDEAMISSDDEPAPVRKATTKKSASRPSATELDDPLPIPPKLLTRLLYEGFEDKDMKIGKEAMLVVGKYMETFVREALARAAFERQEGDAQQGRGEGDGFLQVEDLEKLAPQLLLDF